jgi:hypothetical protein
VLGVRCRLKLLVEVIAVIDCSKFEAVSNRDKNFTGLKLEAWRNRTVRANCHPYQFARTVRLRLKDSNESFSDEVQDQWA